MAVKKRKKKLIVGLVDRVEIKGKRGAVKKKALFDTGATRTSIDMGVAAKAGVGPIIKTVQVKAASNPRGAKRRIVAEATLIIKGRKIKTGVSIEDRRALPYPVLIGRDIIHSNFVIDVARTHKGPKTADIKKAYA
jgi:hypothetical protein